MSSYHGWTHAPKSQGGSDPIPFEAAATPVWAALSTQPESFIIPASSGAEKEIEWYQIYISDSALADTIFDFEAVSGGELGDNVYLNAYQSGIYTFTQQLLTSDIDGPTGSNQAFYYQTRINVLGGAPGTDWGGNLDRFPGQLATTALLQDREQLWVAQTSGDDLWLNRSWTIPLLHPNPGTARRMGEMRMFHDPQSSDQYWTCNLWVARIGDVDWEGSSDFGSGDETWITGDPL